MHFIAVTYHYILSTLGVNEFIPNYRPHEFNNWSHLPAKCEFQSIQVGDQKERKNISFCGLRGSSNPNGVHEGQKHS